MTSQCNTPATLYSQIDNRLHKALKIKAAQTGRTMRSLIEDALRASLDVHDRAPNGAQMAVETHE